MLFAALLAVASCSRTDDARLAVAERQMAEHPDSALQMLRQIDATSLNRHNTALYALLLTQAQYKNDITATSDSLINIALDYFSDGKRHIECLIYKGAVLQELGEEQEAIDYLKKAEAATSPTDNEMLGYINMRLGNIYMNSYIENNEDIAKYKKALHHYKLSGNKKYQLACLGTVGALYRAENMDSAYYYINAAIKLAEELGNSERIAYHKGLLVRAYITDSLIYKAKNAATCLMAEYPEYCDNDLLLDASRIYAMLGNRDSAFFYLQKASKLNLSEPEEIVLLDAKYNIFMADKNYKAALNIVKEKNKLAYEIYNRGQQQKLYITEQKYNKTQVELDKIRIRWIAFVLAFCILLLFGVICFLLKKTLFLSFLFCLLGMSLTFAQETDFNGDADFSEEEFRQKVDSVFQYMEYQGVDTGILIEHGFNFLNPRVFNGQNPDSVYSNKDILKTLCMPDCMTQK